MFIDARIVMFSGMPLRTVRLLSWTNLINRMGIIGVVLCGLRLCLRQKLRPLPTPMSFSSTTTIEAEPSDSSLLPSADDVGSPRPAVAAQVLFPSYLKGKSDNLSSNATAVASSGETSPNRTGSAFTTTDDVYTHDKLVFVTPPTADNRRIHVFASCYAGVCKCVHILEGERAQLKPCRFAALIFTSDGSAEPDLWCLFEKLVDGFPIVD